MATDFDAPTPHARSRAVWLIAGIVLAVLGLGVSAPAVAAEPLPDLHEAVAAAELTVAPTSVRARRRITARRLRRKVPRLSPVADESRPRRWLVPRQLCLLRPSRRGPPLLLV